jgi:hypothetical protein
MYVIHSTITICIIMFKLCTNFERKQSQLSLTSSTIRDLEVVTKVMAQGNLFSLPRNLPEIHTYIRLYYTYKTTSGSTYQ